MSSQSLIKIKIPAQTELAWSPDTELFWAAQGRMTVVLYGASFEMQSGDLLAINRFTLYSISRTEGLCLQFSLDIEAFAAQYGLDNIPHIRLDTANGSVPDSKESVSLSHLREWMLCLLQENFPENPEGKAPVSDDRRNLSKKRNEFNLIAELILNHSVSEAFSSDTGQLLGQALQYIQANGTAPVKVRDIASHCHISAAYLSHIFRTKLHMTPSDFLRKTRLAYAKKLLNEPRTLTEIADLSGFLTLRNFNAAFKSEYGLLPGEYRKTSGSLLLADPAPANDRLSSWLDFAAQTPQPLSANIAIFANAPCTFHFPGHLLDLIEFGPARHLLIPEYRSALKKCQEKFHFRYIQLRSIFDSQLLGYIPDENGIIWDFSALDNILDFLVSVELIPLLQISSIPAILSSGKKNFFGFSNISHPSDIESWRGLIRCFLSHLLDKYGISRVRTWKVGLYYLPAYSALTFPPEEDYFGHLQIIFTLYRETCRVIRSICPDIGIGCPEGDLNELIKFEKTLEWVFRFFKEENCLPDFFPFHDYWNIPDSVVDSENELICDSHIRAADSAERIRQLKDRIESLSSQSIPLWCTSWYCIPNQNPINETMLAAANFAAYILLNFQNLQRIGIKIYGFFHHASAVDSPEFFGMHTLLTPNHIRRPLYYVLAELKKLPPQIIYRDSRSLAAFDGGILTFFLVNAADFSYRTKHPASLMQKLPITIPAENYYFSHSDLPLLSDIQNINRIIGSSVQNISCDITGLTPGQYLLEETILNAEHGSAFDEWLREGAYPQLSREDCLEIDARSLPFHSKKQITITKAAYQLTCSLAPNEIRVLRFLPLRT